LKHFAVPLVFAPPFFRLGADQAILSGLLVVSFVWNMFADEKVMEHDLAMVHV